MRYILIIILCTSCASAPKQCETYNPFQRDSSIFDTQNTKSCKRELEMCRMDHYKKQVDLDACKRDNSLWLNIGLTIAGAFAGFITSKYGKRNIKQRRQT